MKIQSVEHAKSMIRQMTPANRKILADMMPREIPSCSDQNAKQVYADLLEFMK